MRILMVTPYPPLRDGIASYAVQSVVSLRTEGHEVTVLSPGPSAAHQHLDLVGLRGVLALAKRVRSYDRVIVQFHPDFFYPIGCSALERARVSLALGAAFRLARSVEVRVHETDYRTGRGFGPAALATRWMWSQVDTVVVHTDDERAEFAKAFGVDHDKVVLADHGAHFQRYTSADRVTARRSLGVDDEAFAFLTIGFIQEHKGFDRAVRALGRLGADDARLFVVGSLRVETPDFLAYRDELRDLIDATPGVQLREGYVSDELFDRWLVAADCVVLPYRAIWSSGVLERARLYGTPVIATDVGALRAQAGVDDGVTVVHDDQGLAEAMAAEVGRARSTTPELAAATSTRWPDSGPDLRVRLQALISERATAVRGRPLVTLDDRGQFASGTTPVAGARPAMRPRSLPVPAFTPPAAGGRGVRGVVKRLVRKATGWEIRPVADQLNLQRSYTETSLAALAHELSEVGSRLTALEAAVATRPPTDET